MNGRLGARAIVTLMMLLTPIAAPGQGLDLGAGPLLLVADEVAFDSEDNVVTASGNVELSRCRRRKRSRCRSPMTES